MPKNSSTRKKSNNTPGKRGPPADIISKVDRLAALLRRLPDSLPCDPPPAQSTYHFGLDETEVKEEGMFYALTQNLERCFAVHTVKNDSLVFTERGSRCTALIDTIKTALRDLTESERDVFRETWLSRLERAAIRSGSRIPSKPRVVIISDSESDEEIVPLTVTKKPRVARATAISQPKTTVAPSPSLPVSCNGPTNIPGASTSARASTLEHFGWVKLTKDEARAQSRRESEAFTARREELQKQEEETKARKLAEQRENARRRQQKCRAEKRSRREAKGSHSDTVKLPNCDTRRTTELVDLAEISRPGGLKWKAERNGVHKGVVQGKHKRVNWFHPFLWTRINDLMPRVGWSTAMLVKVLQREQPELYSRLNKGTVHHWISTHNRKRWSKSTLRKVKNRAALAASGRVGILAKYPAIVDEVKSKLLALRTSGVSTNRLIGRSIFIAVIKQRAPQLLETFKCSEQYIGTFYQSVLNWSLRKGTRAAAHIPDNALELGTRMFFRIVHLTHMYDIPAFLVVNMDQQGNYLMPHNDTTYHERGSRQVDITAKDEKRAYTVCVASTPDGNLLPFQQVWSGKTAKSLPSEDAEGMEEAHDLGFHFTFADSPKRTSHFSTLKTMKEWMREILRPYIESMIKMHDLPSDQKAILLIDCYPVHIGLEFRTFVWKEFPNVFLIFVPANCTGIFQPADVGIQRPVKHHLRQWALKFLVDSHTKQIESGLTPEQVRFTTSMPVLRDASVAPLVDVWKFMDAPDGHSIVRRAWEKCMIGEWNLSVECIWDRKTRNACRKYLQEDETLRNEIAGKIGPIDLEEEPINDDDNVDDTDIPLHTIIHETVGLQVQSAEHSSGDLCVRGETVRNDDDRLVAGGDAENIWAYDEQGVPWREALQRHTDSIENM
ncbi:hypothetical protein EIP86_005052 [Pleurotus ostreatoroseus]|nr:hypothetical protein EIP86_005052 [Pleurotus ostreatoroseus]